LKKKLETLIPSICHGHLQGEALIRVLGVSNCTTIIHVVEREIHQITGDAGEESRGAQTLACSCDGVTLQGVGSMFYLLPPIASFGAVHRQIALISKALLREKTVDSRAVTITLGHKHGQGFERVVEAMESHPSLPPPAPQPHCECTKITDLT
jgi:hypothetical protein